MKDRLKALRKALGYTQQEFADKLGIKRNTFAQYEIGRNEPIEAVLNLICDRFSVSKIWLTTGRGSMFNEVSQDDDIQRMVDEMLRDDSAETKRRLVAAILRLSPEQIDVAISWIKRTFDLVSADDIKEEAEPTIDQKVDSYRHELEAQAANKNSEVSQIGNENMA